VLARAQSGDIGIDETNVGYNLGLELDRAALPLPMARRRDAERGRHPRRTAGDRPRWRRGDGERHFRFARAESRARRRFTEARGGKFWNGPPPAVDISLIGGLAAPARRIDASALAAGLAAQAIGRDTDRISALEADIRERAWFNRRLKAEKYMRQREAELAAYEADQARQKAEDDRRRAADEAAKAEEDRKRAAADAAKASVAAPNPPTADDASARRRRAHPRRIRRRRRHGRGRGGRSDRDRLLLRRIFEHVDADRRGQVGAVARGVDFGDHGADRAAPSDSKGLEARQKASSSDTLVRWPAIVNER